MTAPRILVVEDESIVALHLRQQLTNLGYEVLEAVATGDRALHKIKASRPDLVLMDINLKGGLDGIATVSRIPPAHRIPVIYLTAYAEEATLARASATKPFGYLLKPFHERELHATIQMALARYREEHATNAALEYRRQTEKMAALGQLAGEVADDFDDLLTVIYGQLEVLGYHAMEHRAMAPPIENAFDEAIKKERLIRRLLAFSGRQKLAPGAVSVHGLVKNVTAELRQMLGDAIQLRTHLPGDLWNAWIDANQLSRALVNLARNARDAMPDGGGLTIAGQNTTLDQDQAVTSTGSNGSGAARRCVILTVSDTGCGMSEDVMHRAFEPFFTTKPAGEGLGLSLVFGFVRQSGGHIGINSEPGGGTTIRLFLPVASNEARGSIAEDEPVRPEAGAVPGPNPPTNDNAHRRTADPKRIASKGSPRRNRIGDLRHGSLACELEDEILPVGWHKADNVLFAVATSSLGEARYRLIVEPLPHGNGWDWAVWRPGDTEETWRHGRAPSIVAAMTAAEAAARQRAEGDPSDN